MLKRIILLAVLFTVEFIHAQSRFADLDTMVIKYFTTDKFMGSVTLYEKGQVVYTRGIGFANVEWGIPHMRLDVFPLASVTKTFTAVLTMQLVEEGKLSLENNISDFLPYFRPDIGSRVTIRHLLTHSSGIPNYTSLPGFMSVNSKDEVPSTEWFIRKYCSSDLQFEPGERFSYNNSGYFILGAILEKVAEMKYSDLLRKKIFRKAGMTKTGLLKSDELLQYRVYGYIRSYDGSLKPEPFWNPDWTFSGGQLYSTIDDLICYHNALKDETLLKKEYQEMMYQPKFEAFGGYYANGWTIINYGADSLGSELKVYGHEGALFGFNVWFARLPEKDQLLLILGNTNKIPVREMSRNIFRLINGLDFLMPKMSVGREIFRQSAKKGIENALKLYIDEEKKESSDFVLSADELIECAVELLKIDKTDDAIAVLQFISLRFPGNSGIFELLGDAYAAKMDKEKAIENYRRALEGHKENQKVRDKLNKYAD